MRSTLMRAAHDVIMIKPRVGALLRDRFSLCWICPYLYFMHKLLSDYYLLKMRMRESEILVSSVYKRIPRKTEVDSYSQIFGPQAGARMTRAVSFLFGPDWVDLGKKQFSIELFEPRAQPWASCGTSSWRASTVAKCIKGWCANVPCCPSYRRLEFCRAAFSRPGIECCACGGRAQGTVFNY